MMSQSIDLGYLVACLGYIHFIVLCQGVRDCQVTQVFHLVSFCSVKRRVMIKLTFLPCLIIKKKVPYQTGSYWWSLYRWIPTHYLPTPVEVELGCDNRNWFIHYNFSWRYKDIMVVDIIVLHFTFKWKFMHSGNLYYLIYLIVLDKSVLNINTNKLYTT